MCTNNEDPKVLPPGTKVVKNPATWVPSEFDAWGAGEGVGTVVGNFGDGVIDVRWPTGRCFQHESEVRRLNYFERFFYIRTLKVIAVVMHGYPNDLGMTELVER